MEKTFYLLRALKLEIETKITFFFIEINRFYNK